MLVYCVTAASAELFIDVVHWSQGKEEQYTIVESGLVIENTYSYL